MPKPELLIFDLDGTLVDTRHDIANSVNYAIAELGFEKLPVEQVIKYVGNGLLKLIERTLSIEARHLVPRATALFNDYYREHLLDTSELYPGIAEVLNHFSDRKMAIVSNKPAAFCSSIVDGLNLQGQFFPVYGGDSFSVMKPDPKPLLTVINKLNVSAERTVMIGDSPPDILAGRAAGCFACAVTYGYSRKMELIESKPDRLVDKAEEIITIFE